MLGQNINMRSRVHSPLERKKYVYSRSIILLLCANFLEPSKCISYLHWTLKVSNLLSMHTLYYYENPCKYIAINPQWYLLQNLPFELGGIQVLRHHDFDLFWHTRPPYHQKSSFPIPTLMMTSSFPNTHPHIFFPLSLINKAKNRQGLFLLKKKLHAA